MMSTTARWRCLLAGMWAGLLVSVAAIATPAPFAVLAVGDAGRVVARVLASEAYASLALAMLLFFIERRLARDGARSMSAELVLVLAALFCTVFGYFGLQPMIVAAKAGQGAWSFAALHGASSVIYAIKTLLVVTLAWRATAGALVGAPSR